MPELSLELGLERAWAIRLAEDGDYVTSTFAIGVPPAQLARLEGPLQNASSIRAALDAGVAIVLDEGGDWQDLAAGPIITALLGNPTHPLGVVAGAWPPEHLAPSDDELAHASSIASEIGLNLEIALRMAERAETVAILEEHVRELEARRSAWERDRRLADEAGRLLRRATAQLHTIIDHMPQALAIVRADGFVIMANPAARELLCIDRVGRVGCEFEAGDKVLSPAELPIARALARELCPGERMLAHSICCGDRHILMSAVPLRGPEGRVEEAVVVVQDITYLRAAEAEREQLHAGVRRRAAELEGVLASIPDAIYVTDETGAVQLTNRAGLLLLGVQNAGELNRLLATHPDNLVWRKGEGVGLDSSELPIARALSGETFSGCETCYGDVAAGREIWTLTSGAPLRDDSGRVIGAVIVSKDIKALKDAERQKDEFLAIAAHELRNPLTSMKGFAQLLLQRAQRESGAEGWLRPLRTIDRQVNRLSELISLLLDFRASKWDGSTSWGRRST